MFFTSTEHLHSHIWMSVRDTNSPTNHRDPEPCFSSFEQPNCDPGGFLLEKFQGWFLGDLALFWTLFLTLRFIVVRENHVSLISSCQPGFSPEGLTLVVEIGDSSDDPGSHVSKRILILLPIVASFLWV